ncbi:hypothetical protein [Specibacter sp. RAF43]|uniref:hypothetical protein n=1 Tax=Specibacter sp. RAF43 TaxID=3233057 RepID=UPI003F9D39B6
MTGQMSITFTPTEELILDVLVARYRLGDTLWTFNSCNNPALVRLETMGLVDILSGVTENTVRASLSDHGLRQHGASWFPLGTTLAHLPDVGAEGPDPDRWSKPYFEGLIRLPRHSTSTDPRAINMAHLLMFQMINRHLPVYQAVAGTNGAVMLNRGQYTVEILADGLSFRLYDQWLNRQTMKTTTKITDVLDFTATCGR